MSFASMPEIAGVHHRRIRLSGSAGGSDSSPLSVHVAEVGTGPALVLLHGWPQHWYCWRRVIPLVSGRRLIMPDLRGHGWSDAPATGYDKEQLVDDLLELIDELELDSVGLVGHDWGGWVGFLAGLRAPERFTGLLALGIIHPFQRLTAGRALQAWRGAYQLVLATPVLAQAAMRASPWFVAAAIAAATVRPDANSDADRRRYGEVFQDPARARATSQLYRTFLLREVPRLGRYQQQHLRIPTRLLIGDGDPISSPALLEGWEDHADDMSIKVIPSAGHFLPEETPHEVTAAIDELFGPATTGSARQ